MPTTCGHSRALAGLQWDLGRPLGSGTQQAVEFDMKTENQLKTDKQLKSTEELVLQINAVNQRLISSESRLELIQILK